MYVVELILLSLCFPAVAVFSYIRFRRKRLQGTSVVTFSAEKDAPQITLGGTFAVSQKKIWCRVLITWQLHAESIYFNPERHRYTLTLTDESGHVLFREERSMTEFFNLCWIAPEQPVRGAERGRLFQGDAVLLEFLVPAADTYAMQFSLTAREQESLMSSVCLHIKEKVLPLKDKNNIHNTVDLRKIKPYTQKEIMT